MRSTHTLDLDAGRPRARGELRPVAAPELRLELESPVRSLTRCRVCGFAEVRTDEVAHRGVLLLAECPRCEHRWTQAAAPPRTPQRARAIPMRSVRPLPPCDEEPAAAA